MTRDSKLILFFILLSAVTCTLLLYQPPLSIPCYARNLPGCQFGKTKQTVVGLPRFELGTSCMSCKHSNQLSYRPKSLPLLSNKGQQHENSRARYFASRFNDLQIRFAEMLHSPFENYVRIRNQRLAIPRHDPIPMQLSYLIRLAQCKNQC